MLDNIAPTVVLTVPTPAPMQIPLSWSSPDPDRRDFDVEYSPDGLVWSGWLTATAQTEAVFIGTQGQDHYFRVRATDQLGNIGSWVQAGPVTIEAVTKYYHHGLGRGHGGSRVAMRQGGTLYYRLCIAEATATTSAAPP